MAFPRLYEGATCPLPGYEGFSFRVLVNPTGQEKEDWAFGNLGTVGCEACAKLGTKRGKARPDETEVRTYCQNCQESRARFGRALVAIFGQSQVTGFDFSTADAALASFEQEGMPDEFLSWLYMLPGSLWGARAEDLKKKLLGPSTTAS